MPKQNLPLFVELLDYWDRCRNGRPMPARADINPAEIPALLPYLGLLDVLPTAPRFRHRLIGTAVVAYFGRDATGLFVDEASYGPVTQSILDFFETVAAGFPACAHWTSRPGAKYSGNFQTICLPLGKDRAHADMLLTMSQHIDYADMANQSGYVTAQTVVPESDFPIQTFRSERLQHFHRER